MLQEQSQSSLGKKIIQPVSISSRARITKNDLTAFKKVDLFKAETKKPIKVIVTQIARSVLFDLLRVYPNSDERTCKYNGHVAKKGSLGSCTICSECGQKLDLKDKLRVSEEELLQATRNFWTDERIRAIGGQSGHLRNGHFVS